MDLVGRLPKKDVVLTARGTSIDLGPGESGYVGESDSPIRLTRYPDFLLNDPYPRPDKFDETTIRLLDVLNPGGGPGSLICEI